MSKSKFKKGEIVELKEGGPKMRVEKVVKSPKAFVADDNADKEVTSLETSYFIDDKPVHGLYAESLLKKAHK